MQKIFVWLAIATTAWLLWSIASTTHLSSPPPTQTANTEARIRALEESVKTLSQSLQQTTHRLRNSHSTLAERSLGKRGRVSESWATRMRISPKDIAAIQGSNVTSTKRAKSSAAKSATKSPARENQPTSSEKNNGLRVLIFSWASEDTYETYEQENYWKACYAAVHNYDLIITDELAKELDEQGADAERYADNGWYREERMYAWHAAISRHLVSHEYDLVFMVGADTLFVPSKISFPLTRYYEGHDLTIMDQAFQWWGYNQNSLLMRSQSAGSWLEAFRAVFYARRAKFNLQADNGSFMETMLEFLGAEAEAEGRPGYNGTCIPLLDLDEPAGALAKRNFDHYSDIMVKYSECFFRHLDALAGPYGARFSNHINFVPHADPRPWANCWGGTRLNHPDAWIDRCFAIHLNGGGANKEHDIINNFPTPSRCPAPDFDWDSNPYNPRNRNPRPQT